MSQGSQVANVIAAIAVLLAVPGAILAWTEYQERTSGGDEPVASTGGAASGTGSDEDASGTSDGSTGGGTDTVPEQQEQGEPEGDGLDGCVITVDHIGAQIHESPRHDARVLASVPSGDYEPVDAATASWAGRDELWYLISVDGRQGWIVHDPILVPAVSDGCP